MGVPLLDLKAQYRDLQTELDAAIAAFHSRERRFGGVKPANDAIAARG